MRSTRCRPTRRNDAPLVARDEAAVAGRHSSPGHIGIRSFPKRDVFVDLSFVEHLENERDSRLRLGKGMVEQAFANRQATVAKLAEGCEPKATRACVAEDCCRAVSESRKFAEQIYLALVLG